MQKRCPLVNSCRYARSLAVYLPICCNPEIYPDCLRLYGAAYKRDVKR